MNNQRVEDAAKRLRRWRAGERAEVIWRSFLTKTTRRVVKNRIPRDVEVVLLDYLPQLITEDRSIVADAWMQSECAEV